MMPPLRMRKQTHPYLGLAFMTGLNLFNYLDRYVLPAVLTPMKADLHLTDAQAGTANTAFMIGYFFTAPLFGYLGDRSPRKWLIAFGIFFWSLGTTLTAFSTSLMALLAFRILVGLGEASYATLAPAWISDLFAPKRRNNALTIFYVAIPVGSALGFLLGGWNLRGAGSAVMRIVNQALAPILPHAAQWFPGDWRGAFLCAGAPGLLLAIGLLTLREPARGESDALEGTSAALPAQPKPGWRDIAGLFQIRDFNLVLLGYTAYTFALGAFGFWAPTFLHRVHGLKVSAAADFFGLVLVGTGLLGTLLGGFAATAWQRRNPAGYAMVLAGSILLAVPVAALAFLTGSTTVSMALLGVSMLLLFLPTGPINTLIVEEVPVMLRASAMALSIFVIHLFGDFWSPQIIGYLSDQWGSAEHAGAGLRRAVLVLPAVLALAAFFWGWLVLRKLQHPDDGASRVIEAAAAGN
jgi:MFS family permease